MWFLYRVLQLLFSQESAANALSKLYYPPVAAVSISYPKEAIRTECLIDGELKGFGQLHPRTQGVETLGKNKTKSCNSNLLSCQNVLITFMPLFSDLFRNYIQLLALSKSSTARKNLAVELHRRIYQHRGSLQGNKQTTRTCNTFFLEQERFKNRPFP